MGVTEPNRERLGQLVSARRGHLGLSLSEAARRAGVDRATWTAIERATRQTEEYNFAGVERAISWAAGSVDRVLAGGEATEVTPPPAPIRRVDLKAEYERLRDLSVDYETKFDLIGRIIDVYLDGIEADRRAGPASRTA